LSNSPTDTRDLAALLNTTVVHLHRLLRRLDRDSGLTVSQASALALLVSAGPHTLTALAGYELVTPPTMTRIVGALESRGFVDRTRAAGDGRQVQIAATPAGRALIREVFSARLNNLARRLELLSPVDRARLEDALELLAAVGRQGDGGLTA
jgi:DNA-binding MarR family transcriptional regulator